MTKRAVIAGYRLVLAILAMAAIAVQFDRASAKLAFDPVSFFSFFTILSNLLGIAVFFYLALTFRRERSALVDLVRGAAVLYLAITGIVYDLLLSHDPAAVSVTLTWVNAVVHQIMPIAVVLDWLVDPPRHDIEMRGALWWLAFPVVWLAYSMIRGAIVDWYPYPFMDPRKRGALEIAVTLVVIAVGFFVVGGLIHWVGRRLGGASPPRVAGPITGAQPTDPSRPGFPSDPQLTATSSPASGAWMAPRAWEEVDEMVDITAIADPEDDREGEADDAPAE